MRIAFNISSFSHSHSLSYLLFLYIYNIQLRNWCSNEKNIINDVHTDITLSILSFSHFHSCYYVLCFIYINIQLRNRCRNENNKTNDVYMCITFASVTAETMDEIGHLAFEDFTTIYDLILIVNPIDIAFPIG